MNTKRILCIGAGRMATAIVAGMVKNKQVDSGSITVANRSNSASLLTLQERFGVRVTTRWQDEVSGSDVILLAIPPREHPEVLRDLATLIHHQLVLTVAAGIDVTYLEAALPTGTPVAWVMPNTAAEIGESISLVARGQHVTAQHDEILAMILGGIGKFEVCTEQQIHDLTAITGSAPAFLYRLAGTMEQMCVEYGVSESTARQMVGQMMYGSAQMLLLGHHPEHLADQVTSPGGATEAGLHVLRDAKFDDVMREAIWAVNARARQLVQK